MSSLKVPFLELDLGVVSLSLGASMNPTGDLVDVFQTKNKGWFPWEILVAPTSKGASITYTRDGKVFVKEGAESKKGEVHSTTDDTNRYSCKGVYSSEMLNSKISNFSDYQKNGLKPYKIASDVDKDRIDLLTIYHDGRVAVQQGSHPKNSHTSIDIRYGTLIHNARGKFLQEITNNEDLVQANNTV
ncbi:hypothetical protein JCM33374_g2815 [Metschnikowia sp. JCM 33374]|nr:hypothetical protein JCM33374_g2815 [Metschnikowia sp. JCM 33374]